MDWKLEVVTVPVVDQEVAMDFYANKIGFNLDIDHRINDDVRLVQLTPPGSACSIHLQIPGMGMEPGTLSNVFLVVHDLRAARAELVERGVDVGELLMFEDGSYRPARKDEDLNLVGCFFFSDPDGNRWCVQQILPRG